MSGRQYNKDQMRRARRTPLGDFLLRYDPDGYMRCGNCLRSNQNRSITITISGKGCNLYHDWATGEYGNSVDYLEKYLGFAPNDAVFALIGDNYSPTVTDIKKPVSPPERANNGEKKPFERPERETGRWSQAYAYLIRSRGISKDTVDKLVKAKRLYQAKPNKGHVNIVFMNKDGDWGELKGTSTYVKFRRGLTGNRSDGYWCFQTGKHPECVYICEAVIDAISLYELHQMQGINGPACYAGIGGTSKYPAIERIIKEYPDATIYMAVDNDDAGAHTRTKYPNLPSIVPKKNDWNEDLMEVRKAQS